MQRVRLFHPGVLLLVFLPVRPGRSNTRGCAPCRRPRIGIRPRLRCAASSRCRWCLVGLLTRPGCRAQADNEKQRRERERREFKEAQELESLRRAFKRMDKKGDGKIDVNELMEELEFLGHKVKPQEAALIIWEVDDDADDCVDWEVSHEPTRAFAAASLSSAPALASFLRSFGRCSTGFGTTPQAANLASCSTVRRLP